MLSTDETLEPGKEGLLHRSTLKPNEALPEQTDYPALRMPVRDTGFRANEWIDSQDLILESIRLMLNRHDSHAHTHGFYFGNQTLKTKFAFSYVLKVCSTGNQCLHSCLLWNKDD